MRRRSWSILLLVVATGLTFGPVVTHEFLGWDDQSTINSNPRLKPPTLDSVLYYWRHAEGQLYIPVTYTFWIALASIAQSRTSQGLIELNPWVYHVASIVLHIGSAVFVYDILRRLLRKEQDNPTPLIGALLFALHPLQVETVAWASGAKDLLCGLLSLAAIRHYVIYASERQSRFHFVMVLVFQVVAMLAKPTGIVVPLIAAALDVWVIRRPVRRALEPLVIMLLLTVPCIVWTRLVQEAHPETYTPIWTRPLIAADAIAFYLYKLVFPRTLTIIYGRTPQSVVASGAIYFAWIVPAAISLLLWVLRRRVPWLVGGALIFVAAQLPVLGFARFSFQGHSTVADHYLYLPMFGVALAAGFAVRHRVVLVYWISGAVLLGLAVRSWRQTSVWRDDLTLFAHAVQTAPNSPGAQGNLGIALARLNRLDEAGPHLARAAELAPDSREAQVMVAQAYAFSGHYAEALPHAQAAVRLAEREHDPDDAWEQMLLGKSLAGLGRLKEAQPHLARAAQLKPNQAGYIAELRALQQRMNDEATRP